MNIERNPPVVVAPARYILLPLAQAITGYSVKAIQCKIHRGEWPEGRVWRRAPDGHIVIDPRILQMGRGLVGSSRRRGVISGAEMAGCLALVASPEYPGPSMGYMAPLA